MRSFPSDLSAKVRQSLQTIANNSQPKLKIAVSRAKTTITDADYWTTETIRKGEALGDVSVAPRRLKSSGPPNRLYEIHVENGQVSTSLREYPDRLKEGWKPQFTLGPSNHPGSVAIAFDGYWERYRTFWRLITSEKPWIFWVDSTGVLWRQHWDDESTKAQMDIDVVKVRALRGWRNIEYGHLDQGIIVGYIKTDGTIYYRNYCGQENGSTIWEEIRPVSGFTGVGVNLNLFITNDYRAGFIIEDNLGQIHWLVSHRNWAGMASPLEHIITSIDARDVTLDIIPIGHPNLIAPDEYIQASIDASDVDVQICPFDFTLDDVKVLSAKRINQYQIKMEFSHKLSKITYTDFEVTNMSGVDKNVIAATLGNTPTSIVLTTSDILPSVGVFPVTYTQGGMRVEITPCCRPLMYSFNVDAIGDPPEIQENITVNIETTTNIIKIYYTELNTQGNESDLILASINAADVTLQIYKVDGGNLTPL